MSLPRPTKRPGEVSTWEAAKILGVSARTVQHWADAERHGLTVRRTMTGRSYLIKAEVVRLRERMDSILY